MKAGKLQNVTAYEDERSVSYVLADDRLFFETSFKMLLGVGKDYFVPCARSRWNGCVKLTYFTRGLRPFDQVLRGLDVVRLATVLGSLVRVIQDIPSTGFLSANYIDLEESHLFVNPETLEVRVVYLPLMEAQQGGAEADADLDLIELIEREISPAGSTPFALRDVANYIQSGQVKYDELLTLLGKVSGKSEEMASRVPGVVSQQGAGAVDSTASVRQVVTGYQLIPQRVANARPVNIVARETVLGKSSMADVSVPYSNAIGRTHCRLFFQQGQLSVMDLQSRNGTYVNGQRAASNGQTALREGDVLRLADVDFAVKQVRGV